MDVSVTATEGQTRNKSVSAHGVKNNSNNKKVSETVYL